MRGGRGGEREREEKRDEKEIGTEERMGGGRSKNEAGPPRELPRTHGCETKENEREREGEEREEGGARERTGAESILPPPHTAYCDVR